MKKNVADKIVNMALNTVEHSVGKCIPAAVHEVKMPESVKKQYLNKDNETNN